MPEAQNQNPDLSKSVNPDGSPNVAPTPDNANPANTPLPSEPAATPEPTPVPKPAAGQEPQMVTPPTFDAEEPVFTPETDNQLVQPVETKTGKRGLAWQWWTIGIIVILAIVGYFFVYPRLSNPPEPASEEVTDSQVENTAPVTTQPTSPIVHQSVFNPGTVPGVNVSLSSVNQATIRGALVAQAQEASPGLTEISFSNEAQSQLPFNQFLTALTPGFPDAANANQIFNDDFTVFIYKNENGSWPGYIATTKDGGDLSVAENWFAALENSILSEFFIVDPGEFDSEFKSGFILNDIADRYNPGTTAGASFGYLFSNNTLLISTSFDGMTTAANVISGL